MGLYDKTWIECYNKNAGKPSKHMQTVQHNNEVNARIRDRRQNECPKDCGYLCDDWYVKEVCLFCYDNSKYIGRSEGSVL